MEIGLLWQGTESVEVEVGRVAARYKVRFGIEANVCYVHPSAVEKMVADNYGRFMVGGVQVIPSGHILRGHFWAGRERKECPDRGEPAGAAVSEVVNLLSNYSLAWICECQMGQNLRQYLELCSDRVEQVASAHRLQVGGDRREGGAAGDCVQSELAPYVKLAQVRALAEDFALALRVGSLRIDSGEGGVVMEFANPNPRPVGLLGMLEEAGPLPVSTALLGLAGTGKPLMARLSRRRGARVGGRDDRQREVGAAAGDRGLAVLRQDPRALRMVCIDPKGRTFQRWRGFRNCSVSW